MKLKYGFAFCCIFAVGASADVCPTAPLTTYLNGGAPFTCTESGGSVTVGFNQNILPSYVGLALLSANQSAADPATITATPANPGLFFTSSTFSETSLLLSSQSELVHFFLDSTGHFVSTNFSLSSPFVSAGPLSLGSALIVGQELVCVGGTFTSLPTGLVTSVTSGVLGAGQFGCNGTALIGTVADSIGPLTAISGATGIPNLTGLSNSASIAFTPTDATDLDVIKIQALFTVAGGTASTAGFGDTFQVVSAVPEPSAAWLLLTSFAGIAALFYKRRVKARA